MSSPARSTARLRHVPALEGLRGLSVAAVLLFHAEISWAKGGFLGVSAFFTLSGFLITALLLAERDATDRVSLTAFWARRARRLLPAAYASLAGIVVFGVFAADGDQVRSLRGDVLAALGYVANWRFLAAGRSYADLFASPSPVQHFWSLAIEEQYYLLFPLLVVGALAAGRGRRTVLWTTLLALAIGSVALSIALEATDRVYYGTDTRAVELLSGALLAAAVAGRAAATRRSALRLLDAAGLGALLTMLVLWSRSSQGDPWLYEGGFALHALLAAIVIGACLHTTALSGLLALRPLRALGRISYGVYLYHWPVYLWLDGDRTGLGQTPLFSLRLAVTLTLAVASYRFLEEPIRSGRALVGVWPRIAAPSVALLLVAAVVAVTADPPPATIVFAAVADESSEPPGPPATEVTGRVTGSLPGTDLREPRLHRVLREDRPVRVMIVGDSVALTLGRGLERWADATGSAQVWNLARRWCGIGRYAYRALGQGIESPGSSCDDWAERWREDVEEYDPDTVVILSTIWEIIERRMPEWSDFIAPGDPVYDEWITSEYAEAVDVLTERGARVVWMALPCTRDDAAGQSLIEHFNASILPDLVRRRPRQVALVDLHARACPNGEFTDTLGGLDGARPDGVHFSETGADWAAGWLMPMLTGGAGRQVGH